MALSKSEAQAIKILIATIINGKAEKNFEADIQEWLTSAEGGWIKATDAGYRAPESTGMALDIGTLVDFVQRTQPKQWARFLKLTNGDPKKEFYRRFNDSVQMFGLLHVLRHGFKDRGIQFQVCFYRPASTVRLPR